MKKKTDSKPLSAAAAKKPQSKSAPAPKKPIRKRGKRGLKPSQRNKLANQSKAVETANIPPADSSEVGTGEPRIVPGQALAGMLTQEENGIQERADARLLRRAVRQRWPSSNPEINGLIRQRAEHFAAKATTIREFYPAASLLVQMERQNQDDQMAAVEAITEAERHSQAMALQLETQRLIADAASRPAIFDRLHPVEGAAVDAGPRQPGRARARQQRGPVEVISASGRNK